MARLTARDRLRLRDEIVRKALRRGRPNPFVTEEEDINEIADIAELMLSRFDEDPENWIVTSRRLSMGSRIKVDGEVIATKPKRKRRK